MDYLTKFLIWSLLIFGNATIIVNSSIFKPIRDWVAYSEIIKNNSGQVTGVTPRIISLPGKLIHCILCMGFWCGVFWGVLGWNPIETSSWLNWLASGCLGASVSWILYLIFSPMMVGK